MSVEVVVPWRGGCSHREKAWGWCSAQWKWPVVWAQGGEPWIKAHAVMPAIESSKAEIIVLADADVHCDASQAVQAVADGAEWARAHYNVIRLTEEGTERYMNGEPWKGLPTTQKPYSNGPDGGGILVARRETLLEIPMDPRFVGWGGEDWSQGLALTCLKGYAWKGREPLIHLWHPPQPRLNRKHGSHESHALVERYKKARWKPEIMRQILKEASAALTHQSTLHPVPENSVR